MKIHCGIEGFMNTSVITREENRPDMIVTQSQRSIVLDLTVGFETNLDLTTKRKAHKYKKC